MTAAGVFYPAGADSAEERLAYYASTFPVVEVDATYYALPAERTAKLWVGADAARLHVRHQGARADDRPGDRDEAAAEGHPRGAARASSQAKTPDLRRRTSRTSSTTRSGGRSATALEPLDETRPARLDPAPVPEAGSSRRSENRALIEDAAERLEGLEGRGRVPQRLVAQREERASGRSASWRSGTIPFVMVDEPQGFKSSVPAEVSVDVAGPRDRPVPRPQRRDLGEEGHHARPSASATSTRRTSCRSGCRGIREVAAQAKETHVLFNNCYANYGTTNAREIAALLLDLEAGAA